MEYFVEIKFGKGTKFYNFSCDNKDLLPGDKVVVETVRGIEFGEVAKPPRPMSEYKSKLELKPILRPATPTDFSYYKQSLEMAKEAAKIFVKEAEKLYLPMRLIETSYTLDGTKCIFTYLADDRIDFRELVKTLATQLKCRVELKQINPREKAMLFGGLGMCGRPICCSLFLSDFNGISISKAKNQMLALNIPKLSGQCGKLLCCLNYEDEAYNELRALFPEVGTTFKVGEKIYTLNSYNVLSKKCKCVSEEDEVILPLNDVLEAIKGNYTHRKQRENVDFSDTSAEKKKESSGQISARLEKNNGDSQGNRKLNRNNSKENNNKKVQESESKEKKNRDHKKENNQNKENQNKKNRSEGNLNHRKEPNQNKKVENKQPKSSDNVEQSNKYQNEKRKNNRQNHRRNNRNFRSNNKNKVKQEKQENE